MFENLTRGRQARNFTTNVTKILDLKSSSEQIFSEDWRWVPLLRNMSARADKGWAVERARPSKKGDAVDGNLLRNFAYFRLRSGLAMWFCPLDTAAVTELWRLDLFSCTSSSFLCAGTLSQRGKCCYFCGRFSWSRQTSHSKGSSYYFHDSTRELYFRSTYSPMSMLFQNKNN